MIARVETMFMEYGSTKYLVIYIKYCKPSKMIWEENWPATRVMYKGVNKGKNNNKVPTTIMLPHLIIRPNKYSMVSCNITNLVTKDLHNLMERGEVGGNLKVSSKAIQAEITDRNYWGLWQWNRKWGAYHRSRIIPELYILRMTWLNHGSDGWHCLRM